MDLRQEPITRENSRTEKGEKDMRAGRNGLAKLKENRSQTHNGKDGNNRKKGTDERIPDKQTSHNPSRNRTPHQKDPKETETGGKGALEPERGIQDLKQPETKAPTALTPITRDRGEDSDPTGAREMPEKAAANLGQIRRVMTSTSFMECPGTGIGHESPRIDAESRKDGKREITPTKEMQPVNGRRERLDKPGDLRLRPHLQTRPDGPLLPNRTPGSQILELGCNNTK